MWAGANFRVPDYDSSDDIEHKEREHVVSASHIVLAGFQVTEEL
jgi:hypothetical protein